MRVDNCLRCGCPCAVDARGEAIFAMSLRSACQHGMCGCHQLAEANAGAQQYMAGQVALAAPMELGSAFGADRRGAFRS